MIREDDPEEQGTHTYNSSSKETTITQQVQTVVRSLWVGDLFLTPTTTGSEPPTL